MGVDQLGHLPGPVREAVLKLVDRIQELGGPRALAYCVFGRAASADFQPKTDRVRSVAIMEQFELEMLRDLAREGAALGKQGLRAPLIMTPEFIGESLDTFPLELLEIQQQHVTVFGDDPFADLSFQPEHVRHQCERELKSLLIGMRQGVLAAAGKEKLLSGVGQSAVDMLLRTLRGCVWLSGKTDADSERDLVAAAEQQMNTKLPAVRRILDHVSHDTWQEFCDLYDDIKRLRKSVDES